MTQSVVGRQITRQLVREFRKTYNGIPRTSDYRQARRDYVQQGLQGHLRAIEEEAFVRYSGASLNGDEHKGTMQEPQPWVFVPQHHERPPYFVR